MKIQRFDKPTVYLTVFVLLLGVFVADAQERLTLRDAINYALENKADAKKAKLSVGNSEHQIAEVRSNVLPQINATGNLMYNPILQESALPGEFFGQPGTIILVPFGQKWTAVGGVHLTQNLFDFSVFTGLKAAKTTREFYMINEELTQE